MSQTTRYPAENGAGRATVTPRSPALQPAADPSGEADFLLQILLRNVEADPGSGVIVTLSIRGSLISGELISAECFFQGQVERLTSMGGAGAALLAGMLDMYAENIYDAAPVELRPCAFVHLRHARVLVPEGGGSPRSEDCGQWWRIRVSAVDGFAIGGLVA